MYRHFKNLINSKGEEFDQREINFIVEYAFKIAINYLKLSYLRVQKLINIYAMSYEDVAIDSIAPLFVKNKGDYHYLLVSSFLKWKPKVKNDDDALCFLNKIVAARVEQHITLLLREADPIFGKILDSVNYFVEKNKFRKINYLGYLYIVENKCSVIKGKVIDPIDFEFLPLNLFRNKHSALVDVLTYIKTHSNYFPAVPLMAFVGRLKQLSTIDNNQNTKMDFPFNQIEVEECIDKGLAVAREKLKKTYILSKKVSKPEGKIVEKVLNEIAIDLKNGGLCCGMYDYFDNNLPGLTKKEFRTRYQNIIEYLFKSMKDSIAARLKN